MKVLILVTLVAVATTKPADTAFQHVARSLAEDEVMKRSVMSDVASAICTRVINSVDFPTQTSMCFSVTAYVSSTCTLYAEDNLGNRYRQYTQKILSLCSNLAQRAVRECYKGQLQNIADRVCKNPETLIG
ncbi:uncharacterized protein LOC106172037 [Lingula anatina]|uniref:Uncharacterized protein LOC106172037 n=1 Tax=Lingula anatina TaxID=7574 RepID=A0A1S3JDV5_LINAN|nr:uncharacterized protein LOC106172037 [Lingula anatina]|eukprot:XP_013408069.1 uncharacterized protein LOC106172037 [Lingula anatina]